jgi:acetoin utilization deacetylase AcuC-like enzyme
LDNVAETLDKLAEHKPSVVFYNAGVDIVPFVSPEIVYRREEMVAERLHGIGAKTVIVMAGGYGDYEDIVLMHLSTIMSFATPRLTTGHSPTSPTLVEL